MLHCLRSVRIRSFSGPYFPAFGLNTKSYFILRSCSSVSLSIQYECRKIRTRKSPDTDTFTLCNSHGKIKHKEIITWLLSILCRSFKTLKSYCFFFCIFDNNRQKQSPGFVLKFFAIFAGKKLPCQSLFK